MFKQFASLFFCGFLIACLGCGDPNAQYQPKPEDIPQVEPANRTGDSGSFLPDVEENGS